jgi:hypothetical protein
MAEETPGYFAAAAISFSAGIFFKSAAKRVRYSRT